MPTGSHTAHLVRSKVDVSRVEDHVIIGVADSLREHLGGSEAYEAAEGDSIDGDSAGEILKRDRRLRAQERAHMVPYTLTIVDFVRH